MRASRIVVTGTLLAASLIGATRITPTVAVFSETETVGGNTFTTPTLSAPGGLNGSAQCILAVRTNEVSWNPVAHATSYVVDRAQGTGPFSELTTLLPTTLSDIVLTGGNYHYRVRAVRAQWTSPVSTTLTLTQPALCL